VALMIQENIRHVPGETEENHYNFKIAVPEIETWYYQNKNLLCMSVYLSEQRLRVRENRVLRAMFECRKTK